MDNLYRIYGLKYGEGWKSITNTKDLNEVDFIIDKMDKKEYARAFIVMHSFKDNCDIPLWSIDLKSQKALTRKR